MNLIIHPTLNTFSACKCLMSTVFFPPCPHPSIKLCPFSLHYKFVFHVLVAKQLAPQSWWWFVRGCCIEFKWCVPPSVPWGHVKVHTSALRRWILRTMNTVSKRRRALLDDCCVREQLPQVAITLSEEGAGASTLESLSWSLNKQLKSKTAETAQIQTGQEVLGLQLTPSRSLLLNCNWNTAHTELSHWTLLLLRFAIDTTPAEVRNRHRSCWGSQ